MTIYKFSEEHFETIQSALNAGIGMALLFDKQLIQQFNTASTMMDDVANEEGEFKPFSTYPEDREKLLSLANQIENSDATSIAHTDAADALADLVKAIITDEAVYLSETSS